MYPNDNALNDKRKHLICTQETPVLISFSFPSYCRTIYVLTRARALVPDDGNMECHGYK